MKIWEKNTTKMNVSNHWIGLWTGLLDWIDGMDYWIDEVDYWTGLMDWIVEQKFELK